MFNSPRCIVNLHTTYSTYPYFTIVENPRRFQNGKTCKQQLYVCKKVISLWETRTIIKCKRINGIFWLLLAQIWCLGVVKKCLAPQKEKSPRRQDKMSSSETWPGKGQITKLRQKCQHDWNVCKKLATRNSLVLNWRKCRWSHSGVNF